MMINLDTWMFTLNGGVLNIIEKTVNLTLSFALDEWKNEFKYIPICFLSL